MGNGCFSACARWLGIVYERRWRLPLGLGSTRKTVLVTGAAGFIGSHLVDRLLSDGFEVIGLDNLMTGDLANLEAARKNRHFHLEIGDVREPLPAYAEIIFNFACPASPKHYQADPYATLTTSALGALRIAEAARMRNCRIVHASTSEVYGDPLEHPQTETYWGNVNPIGERACYDEGKRIAETILMDARRSNKIDARIVRIFNTYGPRMAFDDGRVVSNFLAQVLADKPITIYGDGKQTRSFCFVSDLIDGIIGAAFAKDFDPPVNIGNSREITMIELAEIVMKVSGKKSELVRMPLPADDPKKRCPDTSKANRLFGFMPKVPVEQGIQATYDDFKSRIAAASSGPTSR
jgi:UDP-glucuronate decarboxylase